MKKELFDELLESVREGVAILRGEREPSRRFTFEEPDVKNLREKHGLSQPKFAAMMGISVGTLRNWEQGRRKPEGSARVLLRVVERHPEVVFEAASGALERHRAQGAPPGAALRYRIERSRIPAMPVISLFFGIVIRMFFREHGIPHFHAEYQGLQATFTFDGELLAGSLQSRTALHLIKEWAITHRAELEANWKRAKAGEPLERVAPLD